MMQGQSLTAFPKQISAQPVSEQWLHPTLATLLYPVFIAEHEIMHYGVPLRSIQDSCHDCAPSQCVHIPSQLAAGAEWEKEEVLTLC